jgi:enamine deaminase RidA (YjgF/YER057c/UK114 family)
MVQCTMFARLAPSLARIVDRLRKACPACSPTVVDGHTFEEGVAAFQQVWNPSDPPPAITVHVVAGLAPGFLVEIDAVAVV